MTFKLWNYTKLSWTSFYSNMLKIYVKTSFSAIILRNILPNMEHNVF